MNISIRNTQYAIRTTQTLILLLFCLILPQAAQAKTIYVDNQLPNDCYGTYSIANRDSSGSDGDAYNVIQEALNVVQPADTISIRGGVNIDSPDAVYNITGNAMTFVRPGTSDKRIIISNYGEEKVIIKGSGSSNGIWLDKGDYYTIRGLHFTKFNKAAEGDVSVKKEGIIIEDCEFSYFTDRGIILRNVHDSTFRNLYICHSYEAGFIGYTLCNNLTLINVESSYNDDGKGTEGDADGFAFSSGNGDITMINCTAIDNGEDGLDIAGENFKVVNFYTSGGGACGIKLWRRAADSKSNYTLINVVSKNNNEAGIKIAASDDAPGGDYRIQIYNSVFYGNGEEGLIFRSGRSDIHGMAEIYNTMFVNNGYYDPNDNSYNYPAYLVYGPIAPFWAITSDYNLFYGNWDKDVAWSGEGTHSIKGIDPKLFSPSTGDFHLQIGSPAVDVGKDLTGIVESDLDGQLRPADGDADGNAKFDIGPYERYNISGNEGPVFTYSGPTTFEISENQLLEKEFPAADPEGNELRYLLLSGDILPEMSIDNSGTFRFTPAYDRGEQTYYVKIGVTDQYYGPPHELNITIMVHNSNRPPVYGGLKEYTLIEGRPFRIKLPISDPDGNSEITASLSGLPQSASYDSSSYIVEWNPVKAQVGAYDPVLNLSDGIDSSSYNIKFRVMDAAPYQEPADEGNVFYVDDSVGNDNNNGQTPQTAWKTIQKAKNTLNAGQMVLIRGGTYKEYGDMSRSGTPGSPIIFKAYPGEEVIMDGSSWPSPEAFNIYASNLVIDGLTLRNYDETLFIRGAYENITLMNLKIINAGSYGIQDWGVKSNLRVENVIMDGVGDRGIQLGSATNVHIYNVSIRDFEDRGINIYGDDADNINIINSKIYDSRPNGNFGILVAGKNASIKGTEILNTSGVASYIYSDYAYITNSVISRTRYKSGESIQMLLGLSGASEEYELYNNVLYNGSRYGLYIRDGAKNKIRNCIIYGNTTEIRPPVGLPLNEDYNIFGANFVTAGSHSFRKDPLFTDAANDDFSLKTGSPAIDTGINVGLPFSGTAPDIGAYEYATQGAILYGDVSGDGRVSAYDAAMVAQAAVGLISLTAEQTKAADVSGDGEVSAYDAAMIAQRVVGLIDKFPVEE